MNELLTGEVIQDLEQQLAEKDAAGRALFCAANYLWGEATVGTESEHTAFLALQEVLAACPPEWKEKP